MQEMFNLIATPLMAVLITATSCTSSAKADFMWYYVSL